MKKFYLLLLAVLCIPFAANAQFSEDFESTTGGVLPAGWTIYDEDGLTPISTIITNYPAFSTDAWIILSSSSNTIVASTSWYNPPGQSDDWLVTPQITVPTTAPFLLFDAMAPDQSFPDDYEVLISTTGNTLSDFSTVIHSETSPPGTFETVAVDLSSYAGQQVYIAFRNVANDEFLLYMDNIEVRSLSDNDVAVTAIDLAPYFEINTNNTLEVTLKNLGANVINSVDIEWTDGSNTHSYSATGLNLGSYATTTIAHSVPVTFGSAGEKTISVTALNINGAADADPTNNTMQQEVSVASQSVSRMPLFEEFTSSTCPPCFSFNTNVFNQSFFSANQGDFVLLKYQVNWPSVAGYPNGDPYYTAEAGVRTAYYDNTGAPALFLNNEEIAWLSPQGYMSTPAILQSKLDNVLAIPSYMDITGDYTVTGNSIEVNVTITPYLNGDYVLRVAVIENETTQNAATNGETSFENVMMKMLPDAQGTTISLTAGTPITNNFTMDLSGTNVEEMNDLSVVVFVQDDATRNIMQSAYAINTMGVHESNIAQIGLYPNPSNGFLNVATPEEVDIQISNILGETVFTQKQVTNETVLNLNSLNAGVYFVTITKDSQKITKKIILE